MAEAVLAPYLPILVERVDRGPTLLTESTAVAEEEEEERLLSTLATVARAEAAGLGLAVQAPSLGSAQTVVFFSVTLEPTRPCGRLR